MQYGLRPRRRHRYVAAQAESAQSRLQQHFGRRRSAHVGGAEDHQGDSRSPQSEHGTATPVFAPVTVRPIVPAATAPRCSPTPLIAVHARAVTTRR